jgi:tetratricopeptide (TPR) repeat protein
MRQLIPLFIISILLTPVAVFSCLNEYRTSEMPFADGKVNLYKLLYSDKAHFPYWHHGFDEMEDLDLQNAAFKNKGLDKLDYKELSDYAVLQIKIGDREQGVAILEKLYAQHPEEYNIVANLGTAYEIVGNDQKALELLRKAVVINPISHYGSEWIHINILEQKLGARQYDKIINLGIRDFSQWVIDKSYVFPRPADSLKIQIAYQLHERIGFIKAPDSAIGHLVLDFADIVAKTDVRDSAIFFYNYAAYYNPALQATIDERKKALAKEHKVVNDTFRWASVVWAIPLLAFVLLFAAWLKSIKKNK